MGARGGWTAGLALVTLAGACQEPAAPETDPVAPEAFAASEISDLAEALRAEGASVEVTDETVPSLFSVPGRLVLLDGGQVAVFAFPDADAAAAEVPAFTGSLILWVAPARLFRSGSLLALHVGDDAHVLDLLARVMGPPVASVGAVSAPAPPAARPR